MSKFNRCATTDPAGTITYTVNDARGLTTSVWVGTADGNVSDADPTGGQPSPNSFNNMQETEAYVYDNGQQGDDGNLTESIAYVSASNTRDTFDGYDWRDRQLWTRIYDGTYYTFTYNTYDNLDEVTNVTRYDDIAGAMPGQSPPSPTDPNYKIIAESGAAYDDLGREYRSLSYNPSGTVAVVSNSWFDGDGDVIMSQAGGTAEFVKTVYDGLGDPIIVFDGYDPTGSQSYVSALSVSGDTILNQTDTQYDAAGDATLISSLDSFNDSNTAAGALNATDSRVSYDVCWYDGIGRETAEQDFGALASPPSLTPANGQPTTDLTGATQVRLTEYNARGEANETVDPAGNVTLTTEDDAGRTIAVIQNYPLDVNGNPIVAPDKNIATGTVYNSANLVAETTVTTSSSTQTTQYVYDCLASSSDPALYCNNQVTAVIYADSTNTYDAATHTWSNGTSGYDRVQYTYDRQGEMTSMVDQAGTTHQYYYNGVGSLVADSIVALGANVDPAVQSIRYQYKVCGRLLSVISYASPYDPNNPTSGSALNEVYCQYDSDGVLDAEYHEHNGLASMAASVYVGYGYDESTGVVNGVTTSIAGDRPTTLEYPTTAGATTSRELTYSYGDSGTTDDAVNRPGSIDDGTETSGVLTPGIELESFGYLGTSTIATDDYTQPQVGLDYSGGNDSYSGLDQFDRVHAQVWAGFGTNSSAGILDGYGYGYDLQGDVAFRQNLTAGSAALDQIYTNDDLGQLTSLLQVPLPGPGLDLYGYQQSSNQTVDGSLQSTLHPTGNVLVLENLPENGAVLRSRLGPNVTIVHFDNSFDIESEIAKYPEHTFDAIVIEGHHLNGLPDFSYVTPGGKAIPLTKRVNEVIASRLKPKGVLVAATCNGLPNDKTIREADEIQHGVVATEADQAALETDPGGHWYIIFPKSKPSP
jgi:YD repeat-containing protein